MVPGFYDITPEIFNSVSAGIAALIVAAVAVVGLFLHMRRDRKTLDQHLMIAREQALALKINAMETAKISAATHEIKISMDGRMDELLSMTEALADAAGIKKGVQLGRAQVHKEIAEAAEVTMARDKEIVDVVAAGVVERIGAAVDTAAQTVPGSNTEPKANQNG